MSKSQAAKKGIAERWELAKQGKFEELPPEHIRTYQAIYAEFGSTDLVTLDGQKTGQWFYGPPGVGKSRRAREDNPGAYIKDPKTQWWDGYNGQETVIIDDFDKYQVSMAGELKRWLDRYPFQAQIKGGQKLIRPRNIIITSNYHPNEIWSDDITVTAITRRVEVVYFDPMFMK